MESPERRHSPEQIQILREAFERLLEQHRAVSAPHREAIARRLIVAARAGVESIEDLIDAAEAL